MKERIKMILRTIAEDAQTEAQWLHTLSYLEFVGARKISRTVASSHPTAHVLDHLADETRHAARFADLAEVVGGRRPTEYLCRDAARTYFARLDRELSGWANDLVGVEHQVLNYLLVTSMIERRAMILYPAYRGVTRHEAVRDELATIITEEQDHRMRIEDECVQLLSHWNIEDLSTPSTVESAFFSDFVRALEDHLGLATPLAA